MVKNPSANAGDVGLIPGSRRAPGGGNVQLTPAFLPGKAHGQRSLAGYGPWGLKEPESHTHSSVTDRASTLYLLLTGAPGCFWPETNLLFQGFLDSH